MAIYDTLPVYKVSYDFLLDLFKFTKNFDREYKYTLGEDLKKETTALIANIYRANSSQFKKELLQSARENLEVVRLYLRLVKDLKQISLVGLHEWQRFLIDSKRARYEIYPLK